MRMEGLEPTSLAALDPKSSASTNFATSAINHKDDQMVFVCLQQVNDPFTTSFYENKRFYKADRKMECKANYIKYNLHRLGNILASKDQGGMK